MVLIKSSNDKLKQTLPFRAEKFTGSNQVGKLAVAI
jgi:hypothetical protein